MTTREMMRASLSPGYWWLNVAPLGESPDWQMVVAPHEADGKLFGYDADKFMAKQYKRTKAA